MQKEVQSFVCLFYNCYFYVISLVHMESNKMNYFCAISKGKVAQSFFRHWGNCNRLCICYRYGSCHNLIQMQVTMKCLKRSGVKCTTAWMLFVWQGSYIGQLWSMQTKRWTSFYSVLKCFLPTVVYDEVIVFYDQEQSFCLTLYIINVDKKFCGILYLDNTCYVHIYILHTYIILL